MGATDLPGREFREAFSCQRLREMADLRSFERGVLYATKDRVRKMRSRTSSVEASVRGSATYRVKL